MKNVMTRGGFCLAATLLAGVGEVLANPPAWWSQGGDPVLNGQPENNKGPVRIGQAKHMVSEALSALGANYPTISTDVQNKLTTPQPDPNNPGQNFPAILDLSVPADPKPATWIEAQKSVLLIGQLKAISGPFYEELAAAHPLWLESQLVNNQTKDAADPANIYPWSSSTADDSNKSIANIGQLKAVFSLDFDYIELGDPDQDHDGDGLSNEWELTFGLNPYLDSDRWLDQDDDGSDNLNEFLNGTDPNAKDHPVLNLTVTAQ